jgi:tRNA threonylcarbamoyl adenosine modification protein YeaZ
MTRVVLVIDTATPAVIAAVLRRDSSGEITVLAQRITVDAHAHAELLTPNVVAAVADAGLTMDDIDAVVVGCGPGPFTGLRVGMATAAAYGHALDVPVYGVCSLDAIGGQTTGEVLVITDARRREVYWARYRDGARIDGPGVAAQADVPSGGAELVDFARPSPAGLVAAVGVWAADPAPLIPLYLRRPDAKTLAERAR